MVQNRVSKREECVRVDAIYDYYFFILKVTRELKFDVNFSYGVKVFN